MQPCRQFEETFENARGEKQNKCSQCGFTCSLPSSLRRHMKRHVEKGENWADPPRTWVKPRKYWESLTLIDFKFTKKDINTWQLYLWFGYNSMFWGSFLGLQPSGAVARQGKARRLRTHLIIHSGNIARGTTDIFFAPRLCLCFFWGKIQHDLFCCSKIFINSDLN